MFRCSTLFIFALASFALRAQTTATNSAASAPAAVQTTHSAGAFVNLPDKVITAGGGFLSPNSKFAYGSFSKYLGQGTYSTTAQEYSLVGKKIVSCTETGLTKALWQYRWVTVLVTGLGGGCTEGGAIGSAQGAIDIHLRRESPWGAALSVQKETTNGFKLTGGVRWGR